jgi:two-component system, NarL family, sensor kinase
MPKDYEEVVIVLVAGIAIFLVLTGIVVYIFFFYQQKRFQHQQHISDLQKQFNETLLTSQIEIQEQDFSIISREIHDNVGQVLSLVKIQLHRISVAEHTDKKTINDVSDNVSKVIADLRDIARGLNTERVQIANFHETVRQEIDRVNRSGFVAGTLHTEGTEREIEQRKKLILFRIIQESIQNILKHANASAFNIFFSYGEKELHVTVSDNGAGFDYDEVFKGRNGLGLSNIQSRSVLIGGSAVIASKPGEGTRIDIIIPYI